MKYLFFKVLVTSCLFTVFNSCHSAKNTDTKVKQEQEEEKRQEAFDDLYDNHH